MVPRLGGRCEGIVYTQKTPVSIDLRSVGAGTHRPQVGQPGSPGGMRSVGTGTHRPEASGWTQF